MDGAFHVYRCLVCNVRVRINLNHAQSAWDPMTGCADGCDGTFYHAHTIDNCEMSDRYLGHAEVALTLEEL
jgi:hypothetical protein